MRCLRLHDQHADALEELLQQDTTQNLFLLGFLATHAVGDAPWYGVVDGDHVIATALVLPGRLVVPWGPEGACRAIGAALRSRHAPCMVVGPRDACDGLWATWAPRAPTQCHYDQRLYVCDQAPPEPAIAGFRLAREDEWPIIARHAAEMERADLGRDPASEDPELHARVVLERVRAGRTWIIARGRDIVFQINVGTATELGCQVGGTWVPPRWRRQGLATAGMRAVTRRLLAKHPAVTLHVNESNQPAVRCYERAGYRRGAPFRLITVP